MIFEIFGSPADEAAESIAFQIEMKDTVTWHINISGPVKNYIGLEFARTSPDVLNERSFRIQQSIYIHTKLKLFHIAAQARLTTPMKPGMKLPFATPPEEVNVKRQNKYYTAVRTLLLISTMSRPDITYAVHKCARYMHGPREEHWIAYPEQTVVVACACGVR
jgi:hypothetical protein